MDIPLISLISCIMSRLSYFDEAIFLILMKQKWKNQVLLVQN
jgi:hypothetical protein